MAESIKGFVFDRGTVADEKGFAHYKYLVSFVLVTDTPLENLSKTGPNETIIMGYNYLNQMAETINGLRKYKPPYNLGEAGRAIIEVSNMSPEELERIA